MTLGRQGIRAYCAAVLLFLALPIFAIIPLSFNSGTFLSYPLDGLSLRWYRLLAHSPAWRSAFSNSTLIAIASTSIAMPIGAMAAIGLQRMAPAMQFAVLLFLTAPLFVPVIVIGVGISYFFAIIGLPRGLLGLILAHAVLALPFVILVLRAGLATLDSQLLKAATSLGAPRHLVFTRIVLPLVWPSIAVAGIFAFMTSFDESVVSLFLTGPGHRTLPIQMFEGIREQISPVNTAASTLLILLSISVMGGAEFLRSIGRR